MNDKIYIIGLKSGALQQPTVVRAEVENILKSVGIPYKLLKVTKGGVIVVKADERLAAAITARYPDVFVEERAYYRPLQ